MEINDFRLTMWGDYSKSREGKVVYKDFYNRFQVVFYSEDEYSWTEKVELILDTSSLNKWGQLPFRIYTAIIDDIQAYCKEQTNMYNWAITGNHYSTYYGNIFKANYKSVGFTDTIEIIATRHNLMKVERKDPTCTEGGWMETWSCLGCNKMFFDASASQEVENINDIFLSATGHKLKKTEKKEATLTETGYEAYWECSLCKKLFSDGKGKNEISEPIIIQKLEPISKEGLVQDADGVFRLYKDSALDMQTYGIVDFNGGRFFVANGEIVQANGLISDGQKWYYCSNGQVADYTGLALYDGSWFYVTNGILDTTRAGIVTYDGGRFMVGAGRIVREVNGLIQDPVEGKWYYVAAGQVADYTGLVQYDGAWFYTINGLLGSNFTGDVEYNGSWFHVENGSVVF